MNIRNPKPQLKFFLNQLEDLKLEYTGSFSIHAHWKNKLIGDYVEEFFRSKKR